MTTSISIRKALPADLACLQAFEQGIIAAERPLEARLSAGRVRYYDLAGMLVDDSVKVLLAVNESTPIGCGFARLEKAKPHLRHSHEAYLGLMYIVPHFRGQGVNQQLLDHLIQWCRLKGVLELRLDVYGGNQPALRAYEKAGFSSGLVEMRMTLPDEPA